jgi:FKBP-type peptidyl-prolyl cis-trans isomerase
MAAQSGDRVRIHYVGMLLDGTEFDSTHARSTPFEIELGRGRMIPGMERGLEGVRPGMRRTLVIPPELAYKERALGQIPAHATLVFHVEVLSVEPPPPLPPPQPHP